MMNIEYRCIYIYIYIPETAEVFADLKQHIIDRVINEWQNDCGPVTRPIYITYIEDLV